MIRLISLTNLRVRVSFIYSVDLVQKIPSEIELASRYTVFTLFSLFELFTLFILFKLFYTAKTEAQLPKHIYILLGDIRTLLEWASEQNVGSRTGWTGGDWVPLRLL